MRLPTFVWALLVMSEVRKKLPEVAATTTAIGTGKSALVPLFRLNDGPFLTHQDSWR